MKFGDKLKKLRLSKNISQQKAADAIGVTRRTYITYECEGRYPRNREMYSKLADLFNVDVNYLLTEENEDISDVVDNVSMPDSEKAKKIAENLAFLFKNGTLSEKEKDTILFSLQKAYFESKNYF